ncbi:hypothetical protein V9T40_010656 [Parthenolecanium corni]|uniref:LRRCT domain-containing protein n=1 Tax=Parthenolecanium corni TaxID=536013 RepID=A0AAN9T4K1_9HEMI
MNANRDLTSAAPTWLIVFAWLYLVGQLSFATPVPPCPADCECSADRSGLQKATCTDARWKEMAYPNIHVLAMKRSSDEDMECSIPEDISLLFPQLNFISLKNCSLTYVPANSFRHLKWLQEVDLSRNSIRKLSHSLFAANTKLRYVNVEGNPLDLSSHPLFASATIWEVNLAACDLDRLPASTFQGLPNLRYLSLADNRLRTIAQNSLPSGLKRLDLSGNEILNVPLSELSRLKGLKEIDLSHNPLNCTCQLMRFYLGFGGKGAVLRKQIRCAMPVQYVGRSLLDLPQDSLCEHEQRLTASNQIWLNDGYLMDEPADDDFLFDVKLDRVVGVEGKHHSRRSINRRAKDDATVEGSGDWGMNFEGSGADLVGDDEASTTVLPQSKESAPLSAVPSESSSEPSSESHSTLPSTDNHDPGQPTTGFGTNATESIVTTSADAAGSTIRQPESTELPRIEDVTTISSDSTSRVDSTSALVENASNSTSTSSENSTAKVEDPLIQATVAGITTSTDVPSSTMAEVENKITTDSKIIRGEREEMPPHEGTAEKVADEQKERTSTAAVIETSQTNVGDAGNQSTAAEPIQGQMPKNETMKSAATDTPYVIPSLLIVAVVLVCAAIYFGQQNCRSKSWSCGDTKANGPTELQDVSLLRPEAQRLHSDLYSKKYEAEGQNAQTEKLMNGDGGGGGGGEKEESNGSLPASQQSLASDNVPPVKKSTTRVTTNYDSLPKTPIIIQKS